VYQQLKWLLEARAKNVGGGRAVLILDAGEEEKHRN